MTYPNGQTQTIGSARGERRRVLPSFLLFVCATLLVSGVTLALWLSQSVSNQELLATYARSRDFWEGARSVGGLPWWSPMFLQGSSLAPSWSFLVSNIVLMGFCIPFGFLAGPKIAMIAWIVFGALGIWIFLWRYAKSAETAFVGGILYLLNPSLLTRAFEFEHFVVVASMAVLPWVFLAILEFVRSPTTWAALVLAAAYSTLALTFGKTALMALPAFLIFFVVQWLQRGELPRPGVKQIMIATVGVLLMAFLPALPALRESSFVAMFEFGPFQGWQQAFSTKSPVGWIDRGNAITAGIDPGFAPTSANGGTYLGFLALLFVAFALLKSDVDPGENEKRGRLFIGIYLVLYWLSFGPLGVVGGQLLLLKYSLASFDFFPAISWLLFFLQGWIIFRLIPRDLPGRQIIGAIACGVFYLVPGFRLVEILPLFRDIRAPFDFLHISGAVCLVLGAALLSGNLWKSIPQGVKRSAAVAAVFSLGFLDVLPYASGAFKSRLEPQVFEDFLAAQTQISKSKVPGRVFALSGRYFYLLTPKLSGRPLANEAFLSYLQIREVAALQAATFLSDEFLTAFFRMGGISHILIDKIDPDTSQDLQDRMRKLFPVSFENDHFAVLENNESLGYGFVARDYLRSGTSDPEIAAAVLGGVRHNLATIKLPTYETQAPGLKGTIREARIAALDGSPLVTGSPFLAVGKRDSGNYQRIDFSPAPDNGWLVSTEAWHPDWKAAVNGKKVDVSQALLGVSAIPIRAGDSATFEFRPP